MPGNRTLDHAIVVGAFFMLLLWLRRPGDSFFPWSSVLALVWAVRGFCIAGEDYWLRALHARIGFASNVSVATQPSSPAQTCVVANGSGNQPTADVSNVQVTCTTPSALRLRHRRTARWSRTAATSSASETWAGDGTVHRIPNTIAINAPATVTIQKCAIVELADNVGIDVRGATHGHGGGDARGRRQRREPSASSRSARASATGGTHHWRGLRGLNSNSRIDLELHALIATRHPTPPRPRS